MHHNTKTTDALLFVALALSLLSILASIVDRIAYSIPAMSVSAAVLLIYVALWRGGGGIGGEITQFISNLSYTSKNQKSVIAVLRSSLDPKFGFYDEFSRAIKEYEYSGSLAPLHSLARGYRNSYLAEAVQAIGDSLENGGDLHFQMVELERKMEEIKKKEFSTAKMQGLDSMVKMGAVVFFPIFAGISIEITRITSTIGGATGPSTFLLSIALMFYIASVNNTIVRNLERGGRMLRAAAFSSVQISAALMLFRLSTVIGNMLLR